MPMTTRTKLPRLFALAALLPLGACSVFQIKPADPKPTPQTTPTTPATTPAGRPAATPPAQGQVPPTTQPAGQPTRPTGGAAPATPPAAAPATPTAGAPTTGAPAAGTPAGARPAPTAAELEAQRAVRDSTRLAEAMRPRRRSPVHLVLLVDMLSARVRTAAGGVDQGEETSGMVSLDFALQKARGGGLGLAARTIGGDDKSPDFREVAFLMGSRRFALDIGAAQRTGYSPLSGLPFDSLYSFGRAGFRSRGNLGNTDFSAQFRALYYIGIPVDELVDPGLEGWSGETGLSWTWKRYPLTVNMGYRIERFLVFDREQEISSFSFGGGLLLGRR
jgi:hypothetical protein